MTKLTKILIGTISLVILTIVFFLGHYMGFNQALRDSSSGRGEYAGADNTFQAGWSAAREKIKEHPAFRERSLSSISGIVKNVNSGKLVITTDVKSQNPLDDAFPSERTIIIAGDTQIIKRTEKTREQMEKERADFINERNTFEEARKGGGQTDANPPLPPERFTEEIISLSDIKVNDQVTVASKDNVDIKYANEFEASSLILNVK